VGEGFPPGFNRFHVPEAAELAWPLRFTPLRGFEPGGRGFDYFTAIGSLSRIVGG